MKETKAKDLLMTLKETALIYGIRQLADEVLDLPKFLICSGSSSPKLHHYGKHGLIDHTEEVVRLCMDNNFQLGNPINPKDLFLAALFHDVGKVYDYDFYSEAIDFDGNELGGWGPTDHKYKIHHISRSGIIWSKAAEKHDYKEEDVLHAILAHHGQRSWGSPVEPQTKLAWMLHLCDNMSARMKDVS